MLFFDICTFATLSLYTPNQRCFDHLHFGFISTRKLLTEFLYHFVKWLHSFEM